MVRGVVLSLPWTVHKFGGICLADAERFRATAALLESQRLEQPSQSNAVVVSAMAGVTDALIRAMDQAQSRDEAYRETFEKVTASHLKALHALLPDGVQRQTLQNALQTDFSDIQEVLRGTYLVQSASRRAIALVSGYGELWSAQLLHAYFISQNLTAEWLDARKVLVVEADASEARNEAEAVVWDESQKRLDAWLQSHPTQRLVITGFVASTPDNIPTTFRRNGADLSASVFGALLKARSVTLWKNVDGVYSADPNKVPEAVVLDELSYDEVTELAYFGARVVHPRAMGPAIQSNLPLYFRNAFNPKHPGTKVHRNARSSQTVKGFATVEGIALVNVEGTGMVGIPGVAQRLFGALREVSVSVVMISQASSEHSICFAISEKQADLAQSTLQKAFRHELDHGEIQRIDVTPNCGVLAAVGDGMVDKRGVAASFFSALGKANVNIRAIAQGSSERNISAVIDSHSLTRALRAVHSAFYLSDQTLSIGLIGPGLIGGTFLDQIHEQAARLKAEFKIDLRVRGILGTKKMLLGTPQIELGRWREALAEKGQPASLETFLAHVHADHLPHAVIIDCTASAEVPLQYPDWIGRGLHIITPNKKANTGSMESYRNLRTLARARGRHFLYQTNVGAGLPILSTLRDLVQTGDRIQQIEGIFSGTLSYIFNAFDGKRPFSDIVKEAKAKGFTEPDPRDDLSGMDVARKLVILAREMGREVELEDLTVESLVPAPLRSLSEVSAEEFLNQLPNYDTEMGARLQNAVDRKQVLRYVGFISPDGKASVELKAYPQAHPFGSLGSSDNIVAFTTQRYHTQPLIIRGPGAGPEVTAGGVFADLLRLVSFVGSPS